MKYSRKDKKGQKVGKMVRNCQEKVHVKVQKRSGTRIVTECSERILKHFKKLQKVFKKKRSRNVAEVSRTPEKSKNGL